MGKAHGTYVRAHVDLWWHEKTRRLAAELERCGVDPDFSVQVAGAQWIQLLGWALTASTDGKIGHLRPRDFAEIVRWRKDPDALWSAFLTSGFLDVADDGTVAIHDFEEAAADILSKREDAARKARERRGVKRKPQSDKPSPSASVSADSPRTVRGLSTENPPLSELSRTDPPQPPADARPDAVAPPPAERSAPRPEGGGESAARPDSPTHPVAGPEAAVCDAWRAGRRRRSVPEDVSPEAREVLCRLLVGCRGDVATACAALASFFAADDEFLRRHGWNAVALRSRMDGCIGDAATTAKKRAREADARAAQERADERAKADGPPLSAGELAARMRDLRATLSGRATRDAAKPDEALAVAGGAS